MGVHIFQAVPALTTVNAIPPRSSSSQQVLSYVSSCMFLEPDVASKAGYRLHCVPAWITAILYMRFE